jgi:hypothetical protein
MHAHKHTHTHTLCLIYLIYRRSRYRIWRRRYQFCVADMWYQGSDWIVGEAICIEGSDSWIERHCLVVPHIANLQPLYRTPPCASIREHTRARERDRERDEGDELKERERARKKERVCVCVCVRNDTVVPGFGLHEDLCQDLAIQWVKPVEYVAGTYYTGLTRFCCWRVTVMCQSVCEPWELAEGLSFPGPQWWRRNLIATNPIKRWKPL